MNVRPINSPLVGEHVLTVAPSLAFPTVDAGWSRRTRMFQGRSLDAVALTSEQDSRGAKLAILGQTRSPGIVTGFDVALEPGGILHVSSGYGLLPSGEDVVLGHELRIAPAAFAPIDTALRAAILILTPVTTRIADRFDPEDPCERDESEDGFDDEQRVDGLQVELVPWNPAWAVLDATSGRRNELAYTIFELERAIAFGELAPWQQRGLPIAVLGLDAGAVVWVDRYAVARRGGDPVPRSPLVTGATRLPGVPALWQARILQLADHLADLRSPGGTLPTVLGAQLASLPPAGVIPRDAIDFTAPFTNRFFPPAWRLRAAPLPIEQLDGVLARAAALAPLSTAISEEVMVIVPVPQAVYDPQLLALESVSPEFAAAITQLQGERADWLGHRLFLRNRRDALLRAGDPANVVPYPDPDPDRLEDEPAPVEVAAGEDVYGVQTDGSVLRSTELIGLHGRIAANPAFTAADQEALYSKGITGFIADLQSKISQADDAIDFGFLRAQSDIYRLRQLMLGNQLGTKLATSPALASIAKGDTATTVRDDLSALYLNLKKSPAPTSTPAVTTASSTGTGSPILFARRLNLTETPSLLRVTAVTGSSSASSLPTQDLAIGSTGLLFAKENTLVARTFDGDTVSSTTYKTPVAAPDDIRESSAVIGAAEFRNVTVAERVDPPPASEARQYAVASRHEALQSIERLDAIGVKVDDIAVYSVPQDGKRIDTTYGAIKGKIDSVLSDPPPQATEEASFFHDTVTLVEAHIGTLRGLEGRVAQYRVVLKDCQATLAKIATSLAAIDARLDAVENEITDRRHAVATAEALLVEEQARVARVNAGRAAILANVQLLGYVRPRFFEGLADNPELAIDPALLDSPVPGCIAGHDDAPPELAEMVALLREAPLNWLKLAPPILTLLDRVELMQGLMVTARTRAQTVASTGLQTSFVTQQLTGRFGPAISAVGRAQVDAIAQPRLQVANLDLRKVVGLSWIESRDAAQQVASLGDLIEGDHLKQNAYARAQTLISNIEKVAGCIWAQVGQVLPAIRLLWAEQLDEYEHAQLTVNLPSLPRWSEVPFMQRASIEALAEWLIEQIDRTIPAAVAWMHDLVRACILLASHAPVDQIIAGSVPTAAPAGPGTLVPIIIDPVRVKIGMTVTLFQGSNAVAHGVVEDLVNDRASARIAVASSPQLRLDAGTRARFTVAGSTAAPLTRENA
jgi:hypothetical protein